MAVLSVIVFHIDSRWLPGGFVGVDVFFVISGYLISLHILRALEDGTFSLMEFYRRRVKRIAPAMLVVVAVTLLASQQLFRPADGERVAESALWSLLSLANAYFWLHQDTTYFAAASSEKPLLHLWSLGVEEQFYLLWPVMLMAAFRWLPRRGLLTASCVVAAASFALGEALFTRAPSFVYYMLPTRAGELLVGALTAQMVIRQADWRPSAGRIAAAATAGLVLVAGSLVVLTEDQAFPGLRALPPTVGAAMLILAGGWGDSGPTRLLRWRPLVAIGLVSYSAYLWHWPLLAFYRYGHAEVEPVPGLALLALTLLLAWLTWQYVEIPARHSTRSALTVLVRQYVVPAGVLAAVAVLAMKADGFGLRWFSNDYRSALAAVIDGSRPAYAYEYVCQRQRIALHEMRDDRCVVGDAAGQRPVAILWGDSHAAHYVGMVGHFARERGFRFRNVAIGECPPLDGDPAAFVRAQRLDDCRASQAIVREVLDEHAVAVLAASWSGYESAPFYARLFATVHRLTDRGMLVVLLGTVPAIASFDRLCAEKAVSFPGMDCRAPDLPLSPDIARVNARLAAFARDTPNVEYFDATRYLCPDGLCSAYDGDGQAIYFDPRHLTLGGSWGLGRRIVDVDGVPEAFEQVAERAARGSSSR